VLQFIIAANLSISIIENEYLLRLIDRQNLITASTATNTLVKMFEEERNLLKNYFKKIGSKISFTLDVWTSNSSADYLGKKFYFYHYFFLILFIGVTAHWIDENWELRTCQIALRKVADHKGRTVSKKLLEILEEYELVRKIGWLVTDNASSMIKTLPELQIALNSNGHEVKIENCRVRCICHIIQLVVMTFLNALKLKDLELEQEELVENENEKTVSYRKASERQSVHDDNTLVQSITKIRELSISIKRTAQRCDKWYEIQKLCKSEKNSPGQ